MDQIIEIRHFSVLIFVMGVSGTSSLDAAETPSWRHSKKNHDSSPSINPQNLLLGNAGVFQEADVTP
jgi:hypothetical protein